MLPRRAGQGIAVQTAAHTAELQAVESCLKAEKEMRTAEGNSLLATIKVGFVSMWFLL